VKIREDLKRQKVNVEQLFSVRIVNGTFQAYLYLFKKQFVIPHVYKVQVGCDIGITLSVSPTTFL